MDKRFDTKSYIQADKDFIWHPFTQMMTASDPVLITHGKGAILYDSEGSEYIDGVSSWWVNLHGHSHPYIAKRVSEQLHTLEHVIFAEFTHPPAVDLSRRLQKHLPWEKGYVFFSDNGSTAVEVGLKMALQYWHNQGINKTRFLALEHSYHGDTFGSMSVSARGSFNKPFEKLMFDVERLPFPSEEGLERCIIKLVESVSKRDVAALILEPLVLGAGGMLMYSPATLQKLMKICHQNDVLVIADEVMTGFGRTGKFFATDHISESPDIMSLSKGLTGGTMALGLTVCKEKIYNAFLSEDKMKTFFHGHSFTANPLSCMSALASLDLLEDEKTWDRIQAISLMHKSFLAEISDHSAIENSRQQGTIMAFDIALNGETSYFNDIRDKVYRFFMDRGILLRPLGNTVYILPPYCITNQQLDRMYSVIRDLLQHLSDGDFD